VDRQRNKVITFKISKDSNKNDKQVCRLLLEEIKNINSNNNSNNSNNNSSKIKNSNSNSNNNNQININIIATDGNYSYDKVINKGYNKDCNKHIVSKSETCLVESWNGSLRGRFARFNRRTKAYSKSFDGMNDAVFMWINRSLLIENRRRYASYFKY
jgi:hypothetical protein